MVKTKVETDIWLQTANKKRTETCVMSEDVANLMKHICVK